MPQKEEDIEIQILEFLTLHWIFVWHNDIKGFFDINRGIYRKNKNRFIRPGISDIGGIIPWGRGLAIEVKKTKEISFFDKPINDLKLQLKNAQKRGLSQRTLRRYYHAIEQREYIDKFIREWGVAFYASSINDVIEKMKWFDLEFT